MTEVKMYYQPNIQHLVFADEPDLRLENMPMNRFDTLFYKASTNTLDFSIRDRDRKPTKLHNKSLTIMVSSVETGATVITKSLEKLDLDRGYARFTATESELANLNDGFYNYSVKILEDNGREGYAFVDQAYRVTGQFELRGTAISANTSTQEVSTFMFKDGTTPYYISGAISVTDGTVHTAAWYLTDFMGVIDFQVTTSVTAPTNDLEWASYSTFNTDDLTSSGLTCIKYMNIIGNYTYVRFKYTPDALNTGSMDKVIFN